MAVTDLHSIDIGEPLDKLFSTGGTFPGAVLSLVTETPTINIGENKPMIMEGRARASLVHEGGAKSDNGRKIITKPFTTAKLVYSQRVNEEFMRWSEEKQADFISRLVNNWLTKSIGLDIDTVVLHGMDPNTGTVDTNLSNYMTKAGSSILVPTTGTDAASLDKDFATAVKELEEQNISGVAVSSDAGRLLSQVVEGNQKKYPELGVFGLAGNSLAGKVAATSPEVSRDKKTKLVLGDWNQLLLGFAGLAEWRVHTAGDYDNSGKDLAGHNQVGIRLELPFGFQILDTKAFAVVKAA
jgi:phage capsid family